MSTLFLLAFLAFLLEPIHDEHGDEAQGEPHASARGRWTDVCSAQKYYGDTASIMFGMVFGPSAHSDLEHMVL